MSYERGDPVCFLVPGCGSRDTRRVINNNSEPGTVLLIYSLSLKSGKNVRFSTAFIVLKTYNSWYSRLCFQLIELDKKIILYWKQLRPSNIRFTITMNWRHIFNTVRALKVSCTMYRHMNFSTIYYLISITLYSDDRK